MTTLTANYPDGARHSIVFEGLESLPDHMLDAGLTRGGCLIVSDSNVASVLDGRIVQILAAAGWRPSAHIIPPGEDSKSLNTLRDLYDFTIDAGVHRDTPILAVGGGVVGDLAGFCAATVLRGVPLVHVPTTLLAQVDSSIGGKTGVNHPHGKNLVGAFYQPSLVLSDTSTLATLPAREWTSGLAEVVKHALLDGHEHVSSLMDAWTDLAARDGPTVDYFVPRSAAVKVAVVTADEREAGHRAVLNFGHTVGHAVENVAGYGELSHGEAVTVGMKIALRISDLWYPHQDRTRAWELVRKLPSPPILHLDPSEIISAIQFDKKRSAGALRFVLLRDAGRPEICTDVSGRDISSAWEWLQGEQ